MIHKTSNNVNHILLKPRDLTCLTNTSLDIGLVNGSTTILLVEICFRTTFFYIIASLI